MDDFNHVGWGHFRSIDGAGMSENGLHKIPVMRAALVAIQELHALEYEVRPLYTTSNYNAEPAGTAKYRICANCKTHYPCDTRNLADEGLTLGGGQDG